MRFLIAFVFIVACGDSSPDTDAGPNADAGFDTNGDSEPCGECETVAFSVEVDGEPLTDGSVVDWQFGFQGGTMITPLVVFDNGVTLGEVVELEVRHDPDPEAPELFGEAADFRGPFTYFYEVRRQDGRLVAGPIDDQLGWIDLDGMRLIHTVDLRAARGNASRTAAIELVTRGPSPCDAFEVSGGGCTYYQIPGNVSVAIGDADPLYAQCRDARAVSLTFTPDDSENAIACTETTGWELQLAHSFLAISSQQPPASCLDEVGLTEGATLRATLQQIRSGTCTPSILVLDADTSACDEMCF